VQRCAGQCGQKTATLSTGERWAEEVTGRGSAWLYLVGGPLAFDLAAIFSLLSQACITLAARIWRQLCKLIRASHAEFHISIFYRYIFLRNLKQKNAY